ncbi:MAG: cysteine desulfurase [Alphaproteobacteria bacterium]|nr:cysteine desulfurase [Alphaproteobacteria bacterium]
MSFDPLTVRKDFSILSREIHGKPLTYLDNAASAQKPFQVVDSMRIAYEHEYANVHRAVHHLSNLSTARYESARERVRSFIGAAKSEEIIFTRNATEAINLVASSYGAPNIGDGDEIILSVLEHHSNIVPWHFLRERQGAVLKWVPISPEGDLLIDEFENLLGPRTKFVTITHMSNVLGSVVPVKEVIRLAHKYGVPVLVDGSQAAAHLGLDVCDLDADFYVFTGHKVYGPTGVGVLYGKEVLLNQMRPFNGGGEMILDVTKESVTYLKSPNRFEAGTPSFVSAIGLGAALDYLMLLDREAILAHEMSLLRYAENCLLQIEGLRIFGNSFYKGAILSFELEGVHSYDVGTILDSQGVAIRGGVLCAQPLLASYDLTSLCRVSFAMYNDFADVDRLVAALKKVRDFFV